MSLAIDERRANTTRILINEGRSASKLINRTKLLERVTQEGQASRDTKEGCERESSKQLNVNQRHCWEEDTQNHNKRRQIVKLGETFLTLEFVEVWSLWENLG